MRTLADIDADISATELRLSELHEERRRSARDKTAAVCKAWDDGADFHELMRDFKMTRAAVQGLLWRNGRTLHGRAGLTVQRQRRQADRVSP